MPNGEEQAQHAASAAAEAAGAAALNAAAKPAPARRRVRREGTALGAGLRLMAFCVRHSKPACASPSKRRLAVSISTGRVLQGPASPLACRVASPKAASSAPATHAAQGSQRAAAAALSGPGAAAEEVCSRCQPYNHERRGHRAPDALAVALAKRAFVRALPYRVGGVSRPSQATPLPVVRVHDAQQPSAVFEAACAAAGQPMADARAAGAVAPAEGGGSGRVLSLAQRYEAMARTVPLRLTLGTVSSLPLQSFCRKPPNALWLIRCNVAICYPGRMLGVARDSQRGIPPLLTVAWDCVCRQERDPRLGRVHQGAGRGGRHADRVHGRARAPQRGRHAGAPPVRLPGRRGHLCVRPRARHLRRRDRRRCARCTPLPVVLPCMQPNAVAFLAAADHYDAETCCKRGLRHGNSMASFP